MFEVVRQAGARYHSGDSGGMPVRIRKRHTLFQKCARGNSAGQKGAELLEFAFMLPILLVIIAGVWDFGRAYRTYQVIDNAAREGVRLAVVPAGKYQKTAVQNRVKDYLTRANVNTSFINSGNIDSYIAVQTPGDSPSTTLVTVNLPGGGTSTVTVSRVSVNYPFSFIIFGPVIRLWVPSSNLGGDITLRTSVTMENQFT